MSESKRVIAGVLQMTSTADVDANMDTVRRLVRDAALRGAEMVLVPECFSYLGPEKGKLDIAESLDEGGPILARCREAAQDAGVDVVYGGFWEKSEAPGKVHNACVYMRADDPSPLWFPGNPRYHARPIRGRYLIVYTRQKEPAHLSGLR